jgi:hypothetical protein
MANQVALRCADHGVLSQVSVLKNIAFTSSNAWIARSLFHSSFWDSFSSWGKGTMLVPPLHFPLTEIADHDDRVKQFPQEMPPRTHFGTQAWAILQQINGYRLNSHTRAMMQTRHIENGNSVGKLLRINQRLTASALYHAGLGNTVDRVYWSWVARQGVTASAREFLQAQGIDGVAVCGIERDADPHYVAAAQQLELPIAILIRSWDNLSTKAATIPAARGYLLWSNEMRRELRLLAPWIPEESIHVVGASQFDRHRMDCVPDRTAFFEAVGLDPHSGGPLIMYSCGGTHLRKMDEYAIGHLLKLLNDDTFPPGTQVLVRLHPFLRRLHYVKSLIEHFPDDARVALWPREDVAISLSDHEALLGALAYQAVNVNMASTMTIDSMIFDKPVVNVAFDDGTGFQSVRSVEDFYHFDHYHTIVEHGGIDIAYSPEELGRYINAAIENPAAKSAERADTVFFHVGQVDGLAGQRTAQAMRQCLEGVE